MAYDYKIVSNLVKGSDGVTTVYTAANITAAINWAVGHGGSITYVPAGTYTLTADVALAVGTALLPTTLYGDGDTTIFTGTVGAYLYIHNVSYIALASFKMTGAVAILGNVDSGTAGHWSFSYVHADSITPAAMEAAFWMYAGQMASPKTGIGAIDTVSFDHCTVNGGEAFGFLNFGNDYGIGDNITNVTYTDCSASNIGDSNNTDFYGWVTGFDVVEACDVDHVTLTRCTANSNWCSGFHVEYAATPQHVQFIDCVANNNGTRPDHPQYYGYGFKFQSFQAGWPGHTINGGGTGVMGGGVVLTRCSGTGNYEGMTPIDGRTSWDMKVWLNAIAGNASTGTWYPAGAPSSSSDLVLTRNGSTQTCSIDTLYHSIWDYYAGSYGVVSPTPILSITPAGLVTLKSLMVVGGTPGQVLRVNTAGTALEFYTP